MYDFFSLHFQQFCPSAISQAPPCVSLCLLTYVKADNANLEHTSLLAAFGSPVLGFLQWKEGGPL